MNTLQQLLVATAAVVTLNLTARAAEPALSPKAAQFRHELRKVPSAPSMEITSDPVIGNAKARSLAWDFRKVAGQGSQIDLAHGPLLTLSPKDPRYEAVLRERASAKYLVGVAK